MPYDELSFLRVHVWGIGLTGSVLPWPRFNEPAPHTSHLRLLR